MSVRVRRGVGRKLVVLGLSLLASLAVAEIAVRAVIGAPLAERLPILTIQANPHRGWEMVRGQEHYTYRHRVHVNELGLRGPEVEAKPAGVVRVLALGDSLVYGQGVGDDETLPRAMERALSERDPLGRTWEVVNAGHRAYDTFQELALLDELGDAIAPDVVVLFWFWNDLMERDVPSTYERLKASGPVSFDTGDRVEGWSRARWHMRQCLRKSALLMYLHDVLGGAETQPLDPDFVQAGLERLGGYLDRFVARAAERGFDPVFAIVPDPGRVAGEHESEAISEAAARQARARGLPVMRLLEPLRELHRRSGDLPTLPYDGHYDAAGNRAMGERAAELLLALEDGTAEGDDVGR